jgi:hypothetical protein
MENNRKYFIVPLEYAEELDLFTNEQRGELFRSLLHYSAYGTDSDSNSFPIKLMYRILKKGIDQNFEKYEEISNKRREAGRKGGIISQQNQANESKDKQSQANESKDKQNQANESKDKQNQANEANTKTITNTKTNTNNSSSAKLSERVLEDEFQEIWSIYPRKEGRKNALKAYIKARKNGTSKETILNGLNAYIGKIKAEKTDLQYIKHGSSWFAQECWLDDYSLKNSFEATQTEQQQEEMQEYWQQFVIG